MYEPHNIDQQHHTLDVLLGRASGLMSGLRMRKGGLQAKFDVSAASQMRRE